MVDPFPASADGSNGWQWPGSYPYAGMDKAFNSFMGCLKTLYIGVCFLLNKPENSFQTMI